MMDCDQNVLMAFKLLVFIERSKKPISVRQIMISSEEYDVIIEGQAIYKDQALSSHVILTYKEIDGFPSVPGKKSNCEIKSVSYGANFPDGKVYTEGSALTLTKENIKNLNTIANKVTESSKK